MVQSGILYTLLKVFCGSNSETHLIFVSVRCQDKLTFTRNNPAITPSTSPPTQQRTLVLFGPTVANGQKRTSAQTKTAPEGAAID